MDEDLIKWWALARAHKHTSFFSSFGFHHQVEPKGYNTPPNKAKSFVEKNSEELPFHGLLQVFLREGLVPLTALNPFGISYGIIG